MHKQEMDETIQAFIQKLKKAGKVQVGEQKKGGPNGRIPAVRAR